MLKNNKKQGRIVGTLVITTCLMLGIVWLLGHLLLATNPNSSTLIASETGGAASSSLGSMTDLAKGAVADTAKQIGLGGGSDVASDANESNGDASDALAANDDSSEYGHGFEPIHDQTADVTVTTDDVDFETDRSDSTPSGTIDFAASEPQNEQHGFDTDGGGGIEFENDDVASTTVEPIDPLGSTDSGFDSDTTPDWATDSNDSASNPLANVGTDFGNDSTDIGSPNLETPDPLETSSLRNNTTDQSETNGLNFNTDATEPAVTDPSVASTTVKPELDKQSPKVNVLRPRYKPESVERKIPSANTPVASKKYPVRTWTSSDQKQVQASYVSQDKTSVILAVRGKLYRVPRTRFVQGDRDYLKHVATEGQKAP